MKPIPREPAPQRYVTVKMVANFFGVSEMSIYRLVDDGDLTAIRVGRSIRIPISAVQAFEQENEITPGELTSWAARPSAADGAA